ncbi:hypothetical protein B0H14DRAFT_748757 [Mycena olivaceomarginata]|nr:hypothetical protein B0H14DRAFT_748757 [Mycena olivaceomarginata]
MGRSTEFSTSSAHQTTRTNRFGVPPGFVQLALPPGDICTKIQRYPPGYVISNTTVKKVGGMEDSELLSIGARAVFEVSTNVNEMGLLVLPDGASSWDARSQHIFRDYALKHGRGWYAWVNGDLGRMIRNSGLYLVTGVTKSTSWCIAAENNSWDDQKVSLMLKPVPVGVTAASCAWEWENASVCAHSGPHRLPGEESWRDNQTVFIRGFKVSLRSQKDLSPLSGDNSEDEEWVDEYVPNLFHPSDIINQYLLESVPNAMVAVTHDDEWVSVLNEVSQPL